MKRAVFILFFLLTLPALYSESSDKAEGNDTGDFNYSGRNDGGNFRVYDDLFIITTFIEIPIYNFTFEDISSEKNPEAVEGDEIDFEPNIGSNIGLGVAYKGYGISGTLPLPNSEQDARIYGDTDYFDFQFYYSSRHWGADFFYQNYRGFYLKHPGRFDSNFSEGDNHPQYDDLKIFNLGIGAYYNFNEQYSTNAAFSQGERQLSSAGSFVLDTALSYTRINMGSDIVPAAENSFYPYLTRYRGGEYIIWVIRPGYGYNFIYKRMTIGAIFSLGPNLQRQVNHFISESETVYAVNVSGRIRLSMWFEFKEQFFGGMLRVDSNRISVREFALDSRTSNLQFVYGMFFDDFF